jgi:hypothetical protein
MRKRKKMRRTAASAGQHNWTARKSFRMLNRTLTRGSRLCVSIPQWVRRPGQNGRDDRQRHRSWHRWQGNSSSAVVRSDHRQRKGLANSRRRRGRRDGSRECWRSIRKGRKRRRSSGRS